MATAGSIDPHSVQVVVAKAKTLINAQLKQILRTENLPVSGAKAVMQERIINRMFLVLSSSTAHRIVFYLPSLISCPLGTEYIC